MSALDASIYHLVLESEFRALLGETLFPPATLSEVGYVHCALEASVVPVANDYYADASEALLLLEIDPAKLSVEVRYEAAAPIEGGGSAHVLSAPHFPHVYGPIDRDAITGVGVLRRSGDGYAWPSERMTLAAFL